MIILENGPRNAVVLSTASETITPAQLVSDGKTPSVLSIESIWYDVGDLAPAGAVTIAFDASTDDVVWRCTGREDMCFESFGGIKNPKSAGFTGGIVITGAAAYSIILKLHKSY
jgi:hypothetical protein